MTFRPSEMPKGEFCERFKVGIERVLRDYGVEMPVRVEVINDYAAYALKVYVAFGSPTKLNVNWKIDPDCLSLGFIDEAVAQFEETIPLDARFPIEIPEWQLQNLMSKRR